MQILIFQNIFEFLLGLTFSITKRNCFNLLTIKAMKLNAMHTRYDPNRGTTQSSHEVEKAWSDITKPVNCSRGLTEDAPLN